MTVFSSVFRVGSPSSVSGAPVIPRFATLASPIRATLASSQALRGVGGLVLNAEGQRFCNESGPSGGSREGLGLSPKGGNPLQSVWASRFEVPERGKASKSLPGSGAWESDCWTIPPRFVHAQGLAAATTSLASLGLREVGHRLPEHPITGFFLWSPWRVWKN